MVFPGFEICPGRKSYVEQNVAGFMDQREYSNYAHVAQQYFLLHLQYRWF